MKDRNVRIYKETKNKILNNKIDFIFGIGVFLSLAIIYWYFIIGQRYWIYSDIGSDTFHIYYPFYVNMVLALRNGTFSDWIWTEGVGNPIINNWGYIFDPFGALTIIVGYFAGVQIVQYMLVWMQILKVWLIYLLSKKYIKFFVNNSFSVCIGAYLCAFNGFLFLWGQHYFFGAACIYALLVIIAIENFVRKKCQSGDIWVILSIAASLIYNYYFAYMILLFAASYFIFRYFALIECITVKDLVRNWGRCITNALIGLLMAGIALVPNIYHLLNNTRRMTGVSSSFGERIWTSFVSSFNIREFLERLCYIMSNNMRWINDAFNSYFPNYYAAPQFFCTIFIYFIWGQWIIYDIKVTKIKRNWPHFALKHVLLGLSFFNSLVALISNAFAAGYYRYTFLFLPLISLSIAIVWEKVILEGKVSLIGIFIGGLLTGATWIYAYWNCSSEVKNYVIAIFFVLLLGGLILLALWKSKRSVKGLIYLLALFICASTMMDNYITTNQRTYVTKADYPFELEGGNVINNTTKAIEWLNNYDDSFYRLAKTYEDWHDVTDCRFEGYSSISWYNSSQNGGVMDFYRNTYYHNEIGDSSVLFVTFFVDNVLNEQAISLLGTKYILSKEPITEWNWCEFVNEIDGIYIYRNTKVDSFARWYTKTITHEDYLNLDTNQRAAVLENSVVVEEKTSSFHNSNAIIDKFVIQNRSDLFGQVTCDGSGILMLPIPYHEGWEIYVDGMKSDIKRVDYGFIGVEMEKGQHEIMAKYSIPKVKEGIVISFLGIALMFAVLVFRKNYFLYNRLL